MTDPDRQLRLLAEALQGLTPRELSGQRCPQRAAVAIALAPVEQGLAVAMIRRAERPLDPWSGQMSFPGGRAEPEDADPWATAAREAAEEVELELGRATRLGQLPDLQAMSAGLPLPLAITPCVFGLERVQPLQPQADEVAEALWIPLGALRDGRRAVHVERSYEGRTYRLPGVDYGGRVVWGLSYRMLSSLLAHWPLPR